MKKTLFIVAAVALTFSLSAKADDDTEYGSIYQKECTDTMLGAHGCKPQSNLAQGALNLMSGKFSKLGCAAGNEVFEYPAGSKNFICYHLPSREAWNAKYGAQKGFEVRHPNAPIPTEDERDACLSWGRPIQRTYDGCS